MKAAEMLEGGFSPNPLAWLTPSLGTVDALAPMDVAPPNLKDQTCGGHRKRPAAEDEDADADSGQSAADAAQQHSFLLSALRAPTNPVLLSDLGPVMPIVVYTGPTRTPAQLETLQAEPEAAEPAKKKTKSKAAESPGSTKSAAVKSADDKPAVAKPAALKPTAAKPAVAKPSAKKPAAGKETEAKPTDGKSASAGPWSPLSSSALAASPPPELGSNPASASK
jgi:D-alanyl-D-alanine carboxypeptidase